METLAQSVSTIAPSTTPVATIPLVCALAGNGWGTTPGPPARNGACFTNPLLGPDALGGAIPSNHPYETNFLHHRTAQNFSPRLATAHGRFVREEHQRH